MKHALNGFWRGIGILYKGTRLAAAVALLIGAAGLARAGSMPVVVDFDTSGWVGAATASNASGSPLFSPVSFVGVHGSEFVVPSSLGLGSFTSAALGVGVGANYVNVPFSISLTMEQVSPTGAAEPSYSYIIYGRLNGAFSGPNQSSVVATFDSIAPNFPPNSGGLPPQPNMPLLSVVTPLGVLELPTALAIVPSTSGEGITSVEGMMISVPEPASLLAFGGSLAACAWHRRRQRRGRS